MTAMAAAALASGAASAHGVHAEASGFVAGFTHPLLGLDHVLAMVAVGLWAGQLGGRARLEVPAGFLLTMIAGAGLALAGAALPAVELGIASSVVLLGLLVAARVRATTLAGACIVALFAVFHGYAHGIEIPAAGATLQHILGFAAATAALHAIGLGIAAALDMRGSAARIAGAATAAAGVALALI
ncbi:MAG: HupE/UreJ family protein [Alphaproteobacteria bacterium]|nr:HupE/UreJ family protein [Alphaproteobacteria bacterium]